MKSNRVVNSKLKIQSTRFQQVFTNTKSRPQNSLRNTTYCSNLD